METELFRLRIQVSDMHQPQKYFVNKLTLADDELEKIQLVLDTVKQSCAQYKGELEEAVAEKENVQHELQTLLDRSDEIVVLRKSIQDLQHQRGILPDNTFAGTHCPLHSSLTLPPSDQQPRTFPKWYSKLRQQNHSVSC